MNGYHLTEIPKGCFGDLSKIKEEVAELEDALSQKNRIMSLVELSDLICAIEGFVEKQYDGTIKLDDLIVMAKTTRRAFKVGERK